MDNLLLPQAWNEAMANLSYFPVIVKYLEKIHDTSWSIEENINDSYELVYIKKGTATLRVSESEISLSPHNIVIIKPGQYHRFEVRSASCEVIMLSFTFVGSDRDSAEKTHLLSNLSGLEDYIDKIRDLEKSAYITLIFWVSCRRLCVNTKNRSPGMIFLFTFCYSKCSCIFHVP